MGAPVDWRQVRVARGRGFPEGDVSEVLRLSTSAAVGPVETVKVGGGRVAWTTPMGTHVLCKYGVARTGRFHHDGFIIQFCGEGFLVQLKCSAGEQAANKQ